MAFYRLYLRYATTGNYNGSANLGSDSGGPAFANADKGEWLKLEMPYKLVLDYISICGSTTAGVNPKDWKIYGSNDDKNWDVLLSKTNSVTVAYNAISGKEHTVGATKAYKYFALVVIKSGGLTSGTHYIQVGELEYYGHRENDLVRLPDPTNVLKYPHIAMTGPAQRGYVASSSSEYTSAGPYNAWEAFDGITGGASYWSTFSGTYTTSNPPTLSYTGTTFATNVEGVSKYGEWLQIEFPHIKYSYSTILAPFDHEERVPRDGYIVGSNDLTGQWTTLHRFEDVTRSGVNDNSVTYTPPSSTYTIF